MGDLVEHIFDIECNTLLPESCVYAENMLEAKRTYAEFYRKESRSTSPRVTFR